MVLFLIQELLKSAQSIQSERLMFERKMSEMKKLVHEKERMIERLSKNKSHLAENLKESYLNCETVNQEKSRTEFEVQFYKNMLKSKGLLSDKNKMALTPDLDNLSNQALVIKRGGKLFVPKPKA
jgi:hypothetical protein